ncbi:capsular polysaccharide biosynthesis protein [Salirhabdus euzebyi]|uniref:Capsular polysaccharide biosynthesis protein n=1 Tax=Salirhabdus euzebyi TaxID=394506 RepID=A0A841Q877_9BACI|nr:Wzz/FepE/Etk N-terminal domain-containing protein [Salirhabdus euzebyi]MBB6454524.1 capsular polysaccharide biosynthesis protein [Salirhabdus euzebyi]
MEETISLKEIFQTIKKRLLLILSLMFGATAIAAILSYFYLTPIYQSSSQFIVNQQSQDPNVTYNVNDIRTNVELINTYNVIIKSSAILGQVIEELDLDMTVSQLDSQIQVSSAQNSQVVNVVVQDSNPQQATDIANTVVRVFQNEIPILMNLNKNVNNVHILTEAETPTNPSPVKPNPKLNMAIAFVLGAMVGVGLAFLLEFLDNTIKSEQDVEKHLGLPVLGVVTRMSDDDFKTTAGANVRINRKRGGSIGA